MRGRRSWWWLLTPVLLGGCSGIPGTPTDTPTADAATPTPGPTWIRVAQGRPTPSARPLTGMRSSSPTPGFLPLPSPTGSGAGPTPTCTGPGWRGGQINGLAVAPGPGTATVSWRDAGGGDLLTYRVTATAQNLVNGRQPDVGWRTVAPSRSCARLSVTITGLQRAAPYTVTLEAVFTRAGMDGLRDETVARSLVVSTT